MEMKKSKESITEEYYPISMEILQSFPKFRPKVDLFVFKEDIAQLYPIAQKDCRLTDAQLEEIHEACKNGVLFVSRSDQHIYVDLIAKQAELILFNSHLLESEIVQILYQALTMRLEHLIEQPLPVYYEPFFHDLMVFTEYIWTDTKRLNAFIPKIELAEFNVTSHSITTLIMGSWLYLNSEKDPVRKEFDQIALGLLIHDIGLSKIPAHIVNKSSALNKEENEKYLTHVRQTAILLNKFGITQTSALQAALEHHERIDGSGYPQHLTVDRISKAGCIGIVANEFANLIVPKHGRQRVTTLEAARLLVKDSSLPIVLTGMLLKAYADRHYPDK